MQPREDWMQTSGWCDNICLLTSSGTSTAPSAPSLLLLFQGQQQHGAYRLVFFTKCKIILVTKSFQCSLDASCVSWGSERVSEDEDEEGGAAPGALPALAAARWECGRGWGTPLPSPRFGILAAQTPLPPLSSPLCLPQGAHFLTGLKKKRKKFFNGF